MKTSEVIKKLQELDPTGELHVCCGNLDIHFMEEVPAYYDGPLQILERDAAKAPYYDICGAKYKSTGNKIQIHTLSIADAVGENANLPVDYSELPTERAEATKKTHQDLIQWHKNLDNELEFNNFKKWAEKQVSTLSVDTEDLAGVVKRFYDANINPEAPLSDDYDKTSGFIPSYVNRRQMEWDKAFEVCFHEGWLTIRKRNG